MKRKTLGLSFGLIAAVSCGAAIYQHYENFETASNEQRLINKFGCGEACAAAVAEKQAGSRQDVIAMKYMESHFKVSSKAVTTVNFDSTVLTTRADVGDGTIA